MGNSTAKEEHMGNPVKLTKTLMNQYRKSLEDRECEQQTISMYFCYLNRLYTFLQGDKELTDENLKRWIESLRNQGYSDRTINMHISTVNGLLRFCGRKSVPVSVISDSQRVENMKIAVLMSTYNGEKYLREQVESILAQKLRAGCGLTLFIRDDGSADKTIQIIEAYSERQENVICINASNPSHIGIKESFLLLLRTALAG